MRLGLFSVVDHYPNELPHSTGEFYNELLQQVEAADRLCYESFWFAEHHCRITGLRTRLHNNTTRGLESFCLNTKVELENFAIKLS